MAGTGHRSGYFHVPDVSLFLQGNTYTCSENTFNFRIEPKADTLSSSVWYGMKCYELSDITDTFDAEQSAEGLAVLLEHIDVEYEKYLEALSSGEIRGRRTYKPVG